MEAWGAAVREALLFHPAARDGWRKLDSPESYQIPVPSLPGERALLEDLRGLEAGQARFDRLFAVEAAHAALLDDPRALGPEYDPGAWLGHGCDWEGLARWSEPVQEALRRRLAHHRLILLAAPEALEHAHALHAALVPELGCVVLELGHELGEGAAQALAERLSALLTGPADRLVLQPVGLAGAITLEAMAASAPLRDRVAALILDGCPVGGIPSGGPEGFSSEDRSAWNAEHLSQEALDTELRRSTPYCCLARLSPAATPAGDGLIPWSEQRFEEPPGPPSGRRPVALVELGAAPADRALLPYEVQARSLQLLLAFLLGEGAPRP